MATPMIFAVDDLAEGVYLASGTAVPTSSVFEASGTLEEQAADWDGTRNWTVNISGQNVSDHQVNNVNIVLSFERPVTYSWSTAGGGPAGGYVGDQITFTGAWGGVAPGGWVGYQVAIKTDASEAPVISGVTILEA